MARESIEDQVDASSTVWSGHICQSNLQLKYMTHMIHDAKFVTWKGVKALSAGYSARSDELYRSYSSAAARARRRPAYTSVTQPFCSTR
jgi:hypothetical protein